MAGQEDGKARPRVGRPPKPAGERKRLNRTFRISDLLNERLIASADDNQRSVSEEIEMRLENSFRDEDFQEAFIGGTRSAAALHIINAIFRMSKTVDGKNWENDAEVANTVGFALSRLITQVSGDCIRATDLLRTHPELEKSIAYAGQLIANYSILSYKAEFNSEVMVGREGAVAPPEAIQRFVINREKF